MLSNWNGAKTASQWYTRYSCKYIQCTVYISPNSTWVVTSRHVSTRHAIYLAHAFWHREKMSEKCQACRTARRNTLVTTSATRTIRVQGRRHSVDMSTSFFPEVFPEIDANPEHNRLNLYTRALPLLHRPPCWNKHGSTRRTCRVMSRCDVTSQVEFGL